MGSLNFLVSDEKKEYFDLAKIHLDDKAVSIVRKGKAAAVAKWLLNSVGDFNDEFEPEEAKEVSSRIIAWTKDRSDCRFLSEYDEGLEEIRLARDEDDAAEYASELGEDALPVYRKTGTAFDEDEEEEDEDDSDGEEEE